MNEKKAQITVGFPVYNGEKFIKEAIDSILNQTFKNFELIISDNASTDNTELICRDYAAQDPRIRYYRNEKNLGAAKNYNRVFELSESEFFKWANHDDIHDIQFLEKCLKALEKNSSAILAFPKSILIDEKGQHIEKLFYDLDINYTSSYKRIKRYYECSWTKKIAGSKQKRTGVWMPIYGLIRAEALRKTNLIGNYISSDTILLEELALLGNFCLVPEYLFFKREHPQRSVRENLSFKERMLWFDTSKKSELVFPNWRILCEQFNVINSNSIRINIYDKLLCHVEIAKYLRLKWRVLCLELFFNIVVIVSKFLPNSIKLKERLPNVWW